MDKTEKLAEFLSQIRYDAGISQETMANLIGVSRKTVQNWESHKSCPDVFQISDWCKICDVSPVPYCLELFYSDTMQGITKYENDANVDNALNDAISSLSTEYKKKLLYVLYGSHGSNPKSVIDMIVADLHTPMHNRVNVARTIVDNYEIAFSRNKIVDPYNVLPNMEYLKQATELGKSAAMNGNSSYI